MCIAIAAGTAAAISTATSVIGTAAGMIQAQQSAQMQAAQAQQSMDLQYQQAQQQAYAENQQIVAKHKSDVYAQQANMRSYQDQLINNNEAVNKSYVAEQQKMNEARDKAAFESQKNYIKAIGAKGSVLAAGQSGQSIGLMAQDVDRQLGFAQAEQSASIRSADAAAAIGMDSAYTQAKSANNQAYSGLTPYVQAPTFAPEPTGIGTDLNLGIPSYNWN